MLWCNLVVLVLLLFCCSLMARALRRARRSELRQRVFQLLELAARRGLPLHRILVLGTTGLGRFHRKRMRELARELEAGEELSEALLVCDGDVFDPACRAQIAAAEGGAELAVACETQAVQAGGEGALGGQHMLLLSYGLILGAALWGSSMLAIKINGPLMSVVATHSAQPRAAAIETEAWWGENESHLAMAGVPQPSPRFFAPQNWMGVEADLVQLVLGALAVLLLCGYLLGRVPVFRRMLQAAWTQLPAVTRLRRLRQRRDVLAALAAACGRGLSLAQGLRLAAGAATGRMRAGLLQASSQLGAGEPWAEVCGQLPLGARAQALLAAGGASQPVELSRALALEAEQNAGLLGQLQARLRSLAALPLILMVAVVVFDQFQFLCESLAYVREAVGRMLW